jgi:sugar phosphate isomerase/epimerase
MKSAVTISLVPEARGGPFVYHCRQPGESVGLPTLAEACRQAAEAGFDAVEVFAADSESFPTDELGELLSAHGLCLAAVGTGAGWVRQGLSLTDPDTAIRERAVAFIEGLIDVAADFSAPAILGSMQGRSSRELTVDDARQLLADALGSLGERAARQGQVFLYEPLNRYETDLFNRQADAATFLVDHRLEHVKLLCDLFHMNIEEADPAATLRSLGSRAGHVHWADSNRRAIGMGHADAGAIVAALADIGFAGYLSAEIFPLPTADEAAATTIASFRAHAARH